MTEDRRRTQLLISEETPKENVVNENRESPIKMEAANGKESMSPKRNVIAAAEQLDCSVVDDEAY